VSPQVRITTLSPPDALVPQGKLEPDARQALISKGQQLKQQLEELEAQLVQVGGEHVPRAGKWV